MLRMGLAEPGIQAVLSSTLGEHGYAPGQRNIRFLFCTCLHMQMSTRNTDSANLGERQTLQFSSVIQTSIYQELPMRLALE